MNITDELSHALARQAERYVGSDGAHDVVVARAGRLRRKRTALRVGVAVTSVAIAFAAVATNTELLNHPARDADAAGVHQPAIVLASDASGMATLKTGWVAPDLKIGTGVKTYRLWQPTTGGFGPDSVCVGIDFESVKRSEFGAQACDAQLHSAPEEATLPGSRKMNVLWAPPAVQFARVQLDDRTWVDATVLKSASGLTAIVYESAGPQQCALYQIKGFDDSGVLRAQWGRPGTTCDAHVAPSSAGSS